MSEGNILHYIERTKDRRDNFACGLCGTVHQMIILPPLVAIRIPPVGGTPNAPFHSRPPHLVVDAAQRRHLLLQRLNLCHTPLQCLLGSFLS